MDLMELYQQKKNLLLQFKAITKKMETYLVKNRLEDFSSAVERRQHVIEKVKGIDDKIKAILDRDKASGLPGNTQKVISDVVKILSELKGQNHEVAAMAGERLKKMDKEIKSHARAADALRQYSRTPEQVCGFFLDKEK